MIRTQDFKTKSLFYNRKNDTVSHFNQVALDIGYSSVKGFSPLSVFCFPSFVKKVGAGGLLAIKSASPDDILYKDLETNEVWMVGSLATDSITPNESNYSTAELFGRNRYASPHFYIPARVGLAFGLKNYNPENPVHLQTGLPPKYLGDTELLKEALAGEYHFAVKRGSNPWEEFHFTLLEENIEVTSQPKGTLYSLAYDNHGHKAMNADKMLGSKLIIFDAGFETLDLFEINQGSVDGEETVTECGMRQVFIETTNTIKKQFGIEIPIPVLQQYLKTGTFRKFDRKSLQSVNEPFGNILEESNNLVCDNAITQIRALYNDMLYHDYLVIAGGTGEAWLNRISDKFKGLETLKCISGTQNDTLPSIFSNVRGYYMYQLNLLRRKR